MATAGFKTFVQGTGYPTSHTFNSADNRVTSTNYNSYDNSGNQTVNGVGSPTYTYNLENLMTAVGSTVTYVYDSQDRRVKKTVSGKTTDYFYMGGVVISEKQGSTWMDYIFFPFDFARDRRRPANCETNGVNSFDRRLFSSGLGWGGPCTKG